jgi:hypothetical protein
MLRSRTTNSGMTRDLIVVRIHRAPLKRSYMANVGGAQVILTRTNKMGDHSGRPLLLSAGLISR